MSLLGVILGVLQCVAVCCSVLQCVAVCCSVLQCAVTMVVLYHGVATVSRIDKILGLFSRILSLL